MASVDLSAMLAEAGITPTELAERAGVSRNTIWTLRHDSSRARLSTLRELALACGHDLDITLTAVSDPWATIAARILVGDIDRHDTADETGALDEWAKRLKRWSSETNPLDIVESAATASAPQNRKGARLLVGRNDPVRLASAAIASSADWALSGGTALTYLGVPEANTYPVILWTANVATVYSLLADTHQATKHPAAADVIVAPLHSTSLVGSTTVDGTVVVSPVHAVIDSLGVGGALGRAAHELAESW